MGRLAILLASNAPIESDGDPLNWALDDRQLIKEMLRKYAWEENEIRCPDSKKEYQHILTELSHRNDDSLLFIYYSGHAVLESQIKELRLKCGKDEISGRELFEQGVKQSPQQVVVVALDCCHAGAVTQRPGMFRRLLSAFFERFRPDPEFDKKRLLLASSSIHRLSKEFDEVEHGRFTYYFRAGCEGDYIEDLAIHTSIANGSVTGQTLIDFLKYPLRNQGIVHLDYGIGGGITIRRHPAWLAQGEDENRELVLLPERQEPKIMLDLDRTQTLWPSLEHSGLENQEVQSASSISNPLIIAYGFRYDSKMKDLGGIIVHQGVNIPQIIPFWSSIDGIKISSDGRYLGVHLDPKANGINAASLLIFEMNDLKTPRLAISNSATSKVSSRYLITGNHYLVYPEEPVASISSNTPTALRFYKLPESAPIATGFVHKGRIKHLRAYTRDAQGYIVTGGEDGKVLLWQIESLVANVRNDHIIDPVILTDDSQLHSVVRRVAINRKGDLVAAGIGNTVKFWRVEQMGARVISIASSIPVELESSIDGLEFAQDDEAVFVGTRAGVFRIDITSGAATAYFPGMHKVTRVTSGYINSRAIVAAGNMDGYVSTAIHSTNPELVPNLATLERRGIVRLQFLPEIAPACHLLIVSQNSVQLVPVTLQATH